MLKVSEVKEVLSHIVKNNRFLEAEGKKKNSILIESEAGLGKTSIVQQVAEENGLRFVKINLSNVEQAGDICGFPYKEFELEDGRWMNENQLTNEGVADNCIKLTGNVRTSFAPPSWVPTDDNGIILLLDDFTRAPTHIMQAVMEIVDRGEYISWKLPKDCHVFLTSNPSDSGDYIVTSLDKAQMTRFIRIVMKFDVQEWAAWAELEGIDSRCINFLLLNPEMIPTKSSTKKVVESSSHINARIVTDYFNSISSLDDFSSANSMKLIQLLGEGSVGPEFSTSFTLFVNNKLDRVPSPQQIVETKTHDGAIQKIRECVGKVDTATYKQNIASVLSTRIINYMDKMINEKSFKKKETVERISEIIKADVFSGDINFNLVKSLNARKQFAALVEDPKIVKIVSK